MDVQLGDLTFHISHRWRHHQCGSPAAAAHRTARPPTRPSSASHLQARARCSAMLHPCTGRAPIFGKMQLISNYDDNHDDLQQLCMAAFLLFQDIVVQTTPGIFQGRFLATGSWFLVYNRYYEAPFHWLNSVGNLYVGHFSLLHTFHTENLRISH